MAKGSSSQAIHMLEWVDPQMLLDAIADYAIYQLDPDGNVCSWNAAAQKFKGYRAEEIIGRHFSCFYTQGDVADAVPERALRTALSQGKFEDEGWRVRSDGSCLWASVVINPIFGKDGTHKGFVKITRDISEKREAALQLQNAYDAIAQMQKMESLGRVAGGVAHDFNNLLTAILSAVDLLRLNSDPPSVERCVCAIETAAKQASQLTSQLLAFARHQPLRPVRFSLGKCIEDMVPMLRNLVGGDIEIKTALSAGEAVVEIDETQFQAAIVNMVTNAKDAVGAGGVIEISSKIKATIPTIRKHQAVAGHYGAISVADNGSGIASDVIDKVFDPFFTTKPLYHGTGLGLSQVYGFSKQSGGNVHIKPGSEHGTVITMYLPLLPVSELHRTSELQQAGDPKTDISILFVEDNRLVGESTVQALSDLGYEVVWLEDGERALEEMASRARPFDIIVSDIVMPGISGIDLARKVKARFPAVPIILTSGFSNEIAHIASINCGFIQKPYRLAQLTQCVTDALNGQSLQH